MVTVHATLANNIGVMLPTHDNACVLCCCREEKNSGAAVVVVVAIVAYDSPILLIPVLHLRILLVVVVYILTAKLPCPEPMVPRDCFTVLFTMRLSA